MTRADLSTPPDAAEAAAEAVRALNHLTYPARGYAELWDAYRTAGHLEALAGRLPQGLDQLWRWVLAEYAAGRIVGGRDLPPALTAMAEHLKAAEAAAVELERALREVHAALGVLDSVADGEEGTTRCG